MKRLWIFVIATMFGAGAAPAEGPHRVGGGVNYWVTLDDLDAGDIDEEGFGYFGSYQFRPGMLGVGLDVELLPDRFGEDSVAPQAYALLGDAIYAGAGIGLVYADSDFADDPFFSLRAGLDLELLPGMMFDLYGQYRFESKQELEDPDTNIDTDTVFLGAALRIKL